MSLAYYLKIDGLTGDSTDKTHPGSQGWFVVASFDIWRKIRDSEGTEGWVNQLVAASPVAALAAVSTRAIPAWASAWPSPSSLLYRC